MDITHDYLGDLASLPGTFFSETDATRRFVEGTTFVHGCYVPSRQQDFDANIAVAFRPFQWEKSAPRLWLLTSLGLSASRQPATKHPGHRPPPFVELCAAFREPETVEWADFRAAWEKGSLKTGQGVPEIIHRFALIVHDFATWMRRLGEPFSFGDPVKNATLTSRLPSAVLIPPVPEFFFSGIVPFSVDANGEIKKSEVEIGDWLRSDLLQEGTDHLFLQIAPLAEQEFEVALKRGGWNYFLHALVPTDEEFEAGLDSSSFITNLDRPLRLMAFESSMAKSDENPS